MDFKDDMLKTLEEMELEEVELSKEELDRIRSIQKQKLGTKLKKKKYNKWKQYSGVAAVLMILIGGGVMLQKNGATDGPGNIGISSENNNNDVGISSQGNTDGEIKINGEDIERPTKDDGEMSTAGNEDDLDKNKEETDPGDGTGTSKDKNDGVSAAGNDKKNTPKENNDGPSSAGNEKEYNQDGSGGDNGVSKAEDKNEVSIGTQSQYPAVFQSIEEAQNKTKVIFNTPDIEGDYFSVDNVHMKNNREIEVVYSNNQNTIIFESVKNADKKIYYENVYEIAGLKVRVIGYGSNKEYEFYYNGDMFKFISIKGDNEKTIVSMITSIVE